VAAIRKIHLDFHTTDEVAGIGAAFDPEAFADTLARAHVNMLATPGRCNYGNTYFDAKAVNAHPGLVRNDLFPATVAACNARGIAVQAYYNLGMDAHTTRVHPEWRQLYADGTAVDWGMPLVCFASPHIDESVLPGVAEMIERCPGICGFWFDICLYAGNSFYSPYFNELARKRLAGRLDTADARWALARELIYECCARVDAVVKARLPEAENYFNTLVNPGVPARNLALQPRQEVENPILFPNPEKMTSDVRWLRARGAKTIGLVSRFQGPWMDSGTLRSSDQVRFDVTRTVALGIDVSMGDHRHPDGTLDPEVYRRIGAVYADLAAVEHWLNGARPCREAMLVGEIDRGGGLVAPHLSALTVQAARMLEEAGLQFDIITPEDALPDVPLVVWTGERPATPAWREALRRHVDSGGALFAMDRALEGCEDIFGAKIDDAIQKDPLAAAATGPDAEETSGCGHVKPDAGREFLRVRPKVGIDAGWGEFAQVVPAAPHRLRIAVDGVETLADRYPAVSKTPPFAGPSPSGPAIIRRGRVVYSSAPLFTEAAAHGAAYPGRLAGALALSLLPRPLVWHDAGISVAAHLHRIADGYALHLVHWALGRWGRQTDAAADFPPMGAVTVELSIPEPIRRVALEPGDRAVAFEASDGICRFTLPAGWRIWTLAGIGL